MLRRSGSGMCFAVAMICLSLSLGFPAAQADQERQVDSESGMLIDDHWQLVKAHCTACHSARQFTQQRASRETWLHLIRWMQDKQGLWQFDDRTEDNILNYLEKNYAPTASSRRAPLSPELLPTPTAG